MVQDTYPSIKKPLRPSDDIVKSLLALRDALWEKGKGKPITGPNDPLLVINKILYRG